MGVRRVYTVVVWLQNMSDDEWDESLSNLTSRAPTNSSGVSIGEYHEY